MVVHIKFGPRPSSRNPISTVSENRHWVVENVYTQVGDNSSLAEKRGIIIEKMWERNWRIPLTNSLSGIRERPARTLPLEK